MREGEMGTGSDVAQLCLDPELIGNLKLCFIENYNCIMYIIKGLFFYMYSVVSLRENG